jgi:hypothetical protein
MLFIAAISIGLMVWKGDFIDDIYFRNQLTTVGLLINGSILGLFLLGVLRLIAILIRYRREENAIQRVIRNLNEGASPLREVPENRIISRRYRAMARLHQSNSPINHNALAATLVASESTRSSFPKFINNILILSGVFGTIVSLSIALIGASDLLESSVDVNGMGMVIHGMSTALSTTITAILCYLYFGYFFLKLNDVQTNLVSAVEQITGNYFMPLFQVQTETVLHQFAGLIRSLQGLIGQLRSSQHSYAGLAREIQNSQSAFQDIETRIITALVDVYRTRSEPITDELGDIKRLLRSGFRLPEQP